MGDLFKFAFVMAIIGVVGLLLFLCLSFILPFAYHAGCGLVLGVVASVPSVLSTSLCFLGIGYWKGRSLRQTQSANQVLVVAMAGSSITCAVKEQVRRRDLKHGVAFALATSLISLALSARVAMAGAPFLIETNSPPGESEAVQKGAFVHAFVRGGVWGRAFAPLTAGITVLVVDILVCRALGIRLTTTTEKRAAKLAKSIELAIASDVAKLRVRDDCLVKAAARLSVNWRYSPSELFLNLVNQNLHAAFIAPRTRQRFREEAEGQAKQDLEHLDAAWQQRQATKNRYDAALRTVLSNRSFSVKPAMEEIVAGIERASSTYLPNRNWNDYSDVLRGIENELTTIVELAKNSETGSKVGPMSLDEACNILNVPLSMEPRRAKEMAKKHYRGLAAVYHSDGTPGADETQMKRVNEANEILEALFEKEPHT